MKKGTIKMVKYTSSWQRLERFVACLNGAQMLADKEGFSISHN